MGVISEDMLRHRMAGPDWESDTYQLVLYTLALGVQAQVVYEWGVGYSTLALLRAVQSTGGWVVSCDIDADKAILVRDAAPDALDRWDFRHMSSEELWAIAWDVAAMAELIYIDGCHSLSCVLWEVEHYWPLLKPDGMMVLHDTRDWPDGPGAVFQLLREGGLEVLELPFSCGMGVIHKRAVDPVSIRSMLAS